MSLSHYSTETMANSAKSQPKGLNLICNYIRHLVSEPISNYGNICHCEINHFIQLLPLLGSANFRLCLYPNRWNNDISVVEPALWVFTNPKLNTASQFCTRTALPRFCLQNNEKYNNNELHGTKSGNSIWIFATSNRSRPHIPSPTLKYGLKMFTEQKTKISQIYASFRV